MRNRPDEGRSLNPGSLRHRITWQRKTVSGQDSYGADEFEWEDVITCSAEVREMSGRELEAAQQRWAEARYAIRQHYVSGLSTELRIKWRLNGMNRYLDAEDIADRAGTGRVLDIVAKHNMDRKDVQTWDETPGTFDEGGAEGSTFDEAGVTTP